MPGVPGALEPREEHLTWCKERALAYVDAGDITNAHASMNSDLSKHPGTADHAGIELGMLLAFGGQLQTAEQMRDWIEGLN
jgi:hypothetical protein